MMLRNEPYTRLLQTFFPGAVPDNLVDIFEKIDLSYKLPGEVINVLIHYLMQLLVSGGEQRINRNFVEAIASNMLLKQVNSYEKAVQYIRDQAKVKASRLLEQPEPVPVHTAKEPKPNPKSRLFRMLPLKAMEYPRKSSKR